MVVWPPELPVKPNLKIMLLRRRRLRLAKKNSSLARYSSKGLRINANSVVSMRDLDPACLVPPKTRYNDAPKFRNASLSLSTAFMRASSLTESTCRWKSAGTAPIA